MTAVAGRQPPPLTTDTAAVGRFSQRWATALAENGRVAASVPQIASRLHPLTLRIAQATQTGVRDRSLGHDVGVTLTEQGYGATELIGPTIVVLATRFAPEFAGAVRDWPRAEVVQDRITHLLAAIADGFAQATQEQALGAQEQIQRAALAAVRTAEAQRRTSETRFRALFAQTAVGIGIIGMDGRVIDGNSAWAQMMDRPLESMRGLTIPDLVMPGGSVPALRRFEELLSGQRDHFRLEITHDNRGGRRLFLDLSVSTIQSEGDDPDFLVGVAVDITERKRLEDRLWHEARHDPLTGLPNRTLFFERLGELLARSPSPGPVGICYIDLDGFKSINDGLGHDVGDRLLVEVAQRLHGAISTPGSLLARLGGDEFGVLMDRLSGAAAPEVQADRVLAALAGPITIDGRDLTVSASVGVVDSTTAGFEADALMHAADISLYLAKSRGRGRWERHDPLGNARQVTRHTLSTEISAALARGEFFLQYQPLISLRDGRMRRVEALLRWRHPVLGELSPDQFISMAEENGLIVALGRWVLQTACQQAYAWHQRFPQAEVGINVNVAVGQLHDPELVQQVRSILDQTRLPPRLLHLELTESAVLGEDPGPAGALADLAAAGVRLVIDDFGTGYANLVHLSRLPASELKIAGTFLQQAPPDLADDKIVPAIISLAHSLRLTVTAEGVENQPQVDRLRALSCDTAQGWFFAAPGSAAQITERIAAAGDGEATGTE